MLEVTELRELKTATETKPLQEMLPARIDPYSNFVQRTALMYTIPMLLFGLGLYRWGIGLSRDFWTPLILALIILAPATRLRLGKPLAYKDYMNRDRFLLTYALFPASVWYLAVNTLENPAAAAVAFLLILVSHDALLIRNQLLCVYALEPKTHEGAGLGVLVRFSLPLWGYLAVSLLATHQFASDTPAAVGASSILIALPMAAFWLYWRERRAPQQVFKGIRNVAVVGGGWSGIYAVRWLSEAGLDVTCFEASDSVGGIWKFRPDRPGGVFDATRVTSSKHFLHPSDFPFPLSTPEFPHRTLVLEHLDRYVDHFELRSRFQLGTRVLSVEKEGDAWRVVTVGLSGETQENIFDAVVVSSGPHQNANIDRTSHPLYSKFAGRLVHSAEYKRGSDFSPGEVVLVVGAGESSADIVAELVHEGAIVHWASRSGQWFADRNMGPYPADHITTQGTRVFAGLFGFFEYLVRRFVTGAFVNLAWGRGGHGIPEWLPEAPYLHQFLNKSRDGVLEVYNGNVVPHRGLVRIVGNQVFFDGDDTPLAVDTIILATGFRPVWPFLREQPKALYKRVFHPGNPTLAFVGFARPIVGSIPSLSELQSRWVAAVWTGAVPLPCPKKLRTEVYFDAKHHRRLIRDASTLGMMADQELYSTELASRINAHVHWYKLMLTWPRAFFVMLISPWAPFKYLLNDSDPRRRATALSDTIRELPTPRSPAYLLAIGVLITVITIFGTAAVVFITLQPGIAVATLGIMGLVLASGLRLTARDRKPWRIRTKLREVFPF